mgnify:CR=1 FL=1
MGVRKGYRRAQGGKCRAHQANVWLTEAIPGACRVCDLWISTLLILRRVSDDMRLHSLAIACIESIINGLILFHEKVTSAIGLRYSQRLNTNENSIHFFTFLRDHLLAHIDDKTFPILIVV